MRSERIHAGNWIIFHRGQLIEFMRWAALYCRIVNEPENRTLDEVGRKEKFAKALLIASALWDKRVYQGRLKKLDTLPRTRDQLLDRFRESFSETVLVRIHQIEADHRRAFPRGRTLAGRFSYSFPMVVGALSSEMFVFPVSSTFSQVLSGLYSTMSEAICAVCGPRSF